MERAAVVALFVMHQISYMLQIHSKGFANLHDQVEEENGSRPLAILGRSLAPEVVISIPTYQSLQNDPPDITLSCINVASSPSPHPF